MSTSVSATSSVQSIRCFSSLANIRCSGLTNTQSIAVFVPSASLALLLPPLLFVAYRHPRSSLFLLSIEIAIESGTSVWNLMNFLNPPDVGTYQPADVALSITSSTFILFHLFLLTAIFIGDVRPYLPTAIQGKTSTIVFAAFAVPLIPTSYVMSLLGGFVFVVHRHLRGTVILEFKDPSEERINIVLTTIGIVSAIIYALIIQSFLQFLLIHKPSKKAFLRTYQSFKPLWIGAVSVFFSGTEIVLALIPLPALSRVTAFVIIFVRQILLFFSRFGLTGGLIWLYVVEDTWEIIRREENKITIGSPISETFRKMSVEGTKDFYISHGYGRGMRLDEVPETPDAVIIRTRPEMAPKLSFIDSTFKRLSLLPALNSGRSSNQVEATSAAPQMEPQTSRMKRAPTRKNFGSIYAPKRLTVNEWEVAQWPPKPKADSGIYFGDAGPGSTVSGPSDLTLRSPMTADMESTKGVYGIQYFSRDPFATPSASPKESNKISTMTKLEAERGGYAVQYGPHQPIVPCGLAYSPTLPPTSPTSPRSPASAYYLPQIRNVIRGHTGDSISPILPKSPSPSAATSKKVRYHHRRQQSRTVDDRGSIPIPDFPSNSYDPYNSTLHTSSGINPKTPKERSSPSSAYKEVLQRNFSQSSSNGSFNSTPRLSRRETDPSIAMDPTLIQSMRTPTGSWGGSVNQIDHSPQSSESGNFSFSLKNLFYVKPKSSPEDKIITFSSFSQNREILRTVPSGSGSRRDTSRGRIPNDVLMFNLNQSDSSLESSNTTQNTTRRTQYRESDDYDSYYETSPEVLASLARLRRETGLNLDESRFSRSAHTRQSVKTTLSPIFSENGGGNSVPRDTTEDRWNENSDWRAGNESNGFDGISASGQVSKRKTSMAYGPQDGTRRNWSNAFQASLKGEGRRNGGDQQPEKPQRSMMRTIGKEKRTIHIDRDNRI